MASALEGKTALVTGASAGIGRACAIALAGAGARVAVVARATDRAQAAAAELPENGHRGYGCDVADGAGVDALLSQVEKELGSLDILVNNAGVTGDNLLLRLNDAEWDRVLDTNLKGAFHTIRAAVRGMMRRRDGRIINITSIVGLIGNKGQANYAASKAGLIGLTKSVARELASRNILCNAVAPGFIETEMTARMPLATREVGRRMNSLSQGGRPVDVAEAVAWFASPASTAVNGNVVRVCGQMMLGA
jgi:3-oxoacyl-[acyl-carrier protein] reductase